MNNEHTFQLPDQLSTFANDVDWLYYFVYWISVVLFVGIIGAALYFCWKYRRSVNPTSEPTGHNVPLEVAWTIAPVIFLALVFHWGFEGYVKLTVVPANAIDIRVRARKWSWDFEYANGGHSQGGMPSPGQPAPLGLHVPVGRPVRLVISSEDVLHAMYIPGFRVKRDAVPGYYSTLWFEATHEGTTHFFCAEYCGAAGNTPAADGSYSGHFNMQGEVHIDSPAQYAAFLDSIIGPPGECAGNAACWGERLYRQQQCFTCHSTNGSPMTGPTWQGIWGRQEQITGGGTVTVDENYVRESILNPTAKIVQGFQPVMPTFRGTLNDRQIDALIAYMRTLHN